MLAKCKNVSHRSFSVKSVQLLLHKAGEPFTPIYRFDALQLLVYVMCISLESSLISFHFVRNMGNRCSARPQQDL